MTLALNSILSTESNYKEVRNVRIGFNIALVCIVALICIGAVTVTGLAMGYNGTVIALSFVALGAIPASLITWLRTKHTEKKETTKNGGV